MSGFEDMRGELRIYCICGQKMRVARASFGRPGKCIACRQKIRIPRPDEIPEGTTEVYLKEHPEFLRKVEPEREEGEQAAEGDEAQEDVALGEQVEAEESIPLDVLEALRVICSFEHYVQRQLDVLGLGGTIDPDAPDKATLLGYRARARRARARLDGELRERLREVTTQLSSTLEQIARATLALRVGEMDYATFVKGVVPLRERRERLERRQRNLRGWLGVKDPYLAGGYIKVGPDDLPVGDIEVTFPLEPKSRQSFVEACIEELHSALAARECAERKLEERERMEREGELSGATLEDCRADSEAVRQRARAGVAFCRERLEQVIHDCESDVKAIRAYTSLMRSRYESGEIDSEKLDGIVSRLRRAEADHGKARDVARRALSANSVADVPYPGGTFLHRIAGPPAAAGGIGLDSWIAWAASAVLVVTIIAPISRAQMVGNVGAMGEMAVGLFFAAATLAIFASVPKPEVRGWLVAALWCVLCVAWACNLQWVWYSLNPIGQAMRRDPYWFARPGVLLFALAALLIGVAVYVALLPNKRCRPFLAAGTAILVVVVGAILTDMGGLFVASPTLGSPEITESPVRDNTYVVTVPVGNRGGFRRALWVGSRRDERPNLVVFLLERSLGENSWEDVGMPAATKQGDLPWRETAREEVLQPLEIRSGRDAIFRYRLAPGKYRAHLISDLECSGEPVKTFTLEPVLPPPPAEPVPVAAVRQEEALPVVEEPAEAPSPPAERRIVKMRLLGVLNAEGRDPGFRVSLRMPDGSIKEPNLHLGDEICAPWKALEYNPSNNTLTVGNGKRLLVIERGTELELPVEVETGNPTGM